MYQKRKCFQMDLRKCGKCDVIKKRYVFERKQQKCAFENFLALVLILFETLVYIIINN